MRKFAWLLIAAGLLLSLYSIRWANIETGARVHQWLDGGIRSGDYAVVSANLRMMSQGLVPAWTVASPWPGIAGGLATSAFGILILAIRRPTKSSEAMGACAACGAPSEIYRLKGLRMTRLCAACSR